MEGLLLVAEQTSAVAHIIRGIHRTRTLHGMPVLCKTSSCTDSATPRASHEHTMHNAEQLKLFTTEISACVH